MVLSSGFRMLGSGFRV